MFGYSVDELEKLSNCIFFAVALFTRRLAKGERGYIAIRRSDYCRFPHFLYVRTDPTGKTRFVSFVPDVHVECDFPPPLFIGHVQWGDPVPIKKGQHHDVADGYCSNCGKHVEGNTKPATR